MKRTHVFAKRKKFNAVLYWGALLMLVLCFGCAKQSPPWQGYNIPPAQRDDGKARQAGYSAQGTDQRKHDAGGGYTGRYDSRGTDRRGYDSDGGYTGRYETDGRYARPDRSGRYDSGRVGTWGLPRDYQDFKARYARQGVTPEGAVKLYFDAVFCYINPATRAEASKMLRYSMRLQQGWERSSFHRIFVERMEDPHYTHIFRSFAAGTSVHDGYAMSPDNYRLDVIKIWDGHSSGDLQVRLRSSGADNPRSVYVRQYDGLWFVTNNAGTFAEVRYPQTEIDRTGHDADYDDINYGRRY